VPRCTVEAAELYQRPDDKPEIVGTGSTSLHAPAPLIDYYTRQHKLENIDANERRRRAADITSG